MLALDELRHQLLAQAVDVERMLRGEVADHLTPLGGALHADAAVGGGALLADARRCRRRGTASASRTRVSLPVARARDHLDDVGDDVPGALDHHGVADAHVLALALRPCCAARRSRWSRRRPRPARARATGVMMPVRPTEADDAENLRRALLGLELERDRPARRARHLAEAALQVEAVHLGDHAVDLVGERRRAWPRSRSW